MANRVGKAGAMLMTQQRRYRARLAETEADVLAAQHLRHRCFRGVEGVDADAFDDACQHVLVEETMSGRLVCCFRLMHLADGSGVEGTYSAQFYDLTNLSAFRDPMAEMGRFCILAGLRDPDLLRVAWGMMAALVDDRDVRMLLGCTSFSGTNADVYRDTFAFLGRRHLAPPLYLPSIKAPQVYTFASDLKDAPLDAKRAIKTMPPLMRSYIAMGGWVSDHAVIDHDLDTLHVFTGLEIAKIPEDRKRLIRE